MRPPSGTTKAVHRVRRLTRGLKPTLADPQQQRQPCPGFAYARQPAARCRSCLEAMGESARSPRAARSDGLARVSRGPSFLTDLMTIGATRCPCRVACVPPTTSISAHACPHHCDGVSSIAMPIVPSCLRGVPGTFARVELGLGSIRGPGRSPIVEDSRCRSHYRDRADAIAPSGVRD
jgi:hypothetical protein